MLPRAPIRAAPSGVTSVHIGVRPRVHPSRANESLERNQPDTNVPVPLFSPHTSQNADLPGSEPVKGSYNTRYTTELMDKAKAEYEAWLARKAEREGGIGGEEGGVGDFVPRDRSVALPRAVGGQAPPESWDEPKKSSRSAGSSDNSSVATPAEGEFQWKNGYGYTWPAAGAAVDPSLAQAQMYQYPGVMQPTPGWAQEDWARWYATQQAYWDPSYWWGQGMPGMQGMQGMQESMYPGVPGEGEEQNPSSET